jgi:DNA-binding transcriptional ArsR family regulator
MDVYAALADPTRRQIVAMLADRERSAGEIAGRFEVAGPSISRHLRVLRESGVVSYRQQAQSRLYRLEREQLAEARQWLDLQLRAVEASFDRLGAHLNAMKARED